MRAVIGPVHYDGIIGNPQFIEIIEHLADMQALRDALSLPLLELGAWWGDLDVYAFEDELPSQYESIFLDDGLFAGTHAGAGPDLRNEVFALRPDHPTPAHVLEDGVDYVPTKRHVLWGHHFASIAGAAPKTTRATMRTSSSSPKPMLKGMGGF